MFDPNRDGVDHINIYSKGKTELGRWMSNFTREPIEVPGHGHFDSIEGYWYWLSKGDDRLRTMSGFAAKQLGKSLPVNPQFHQQSSEALEFSFRLMIVEALKAKAAKRPDMVAKLRATSLPLTHYYAFNGTVKMAGYEWITQFWSDLRKGV